MSETAQVELRKWTSVSPCPQVVVRTIRLRDGKQGAAGQGLMDSARHVTRCHSAHEARVRIVFEDAAFTIHQSLPPAAMVTKVKLVFSPRAKCIGWSIL